MARRRRKRGHSGARSALQDASILSPTGAILLTRALAPSVDSDVRQRGEGYFQQGRVLKPEASAERLSAEVDGKTGHYQVTVDMGFDQQGERSNISAICSCPFFGEGRGCCKHIWAVLCHADADAECAFKATPGRPVAFLNKLLASPQPSHMQRRTLPTKPRRMTTVVSVAPGENSRIRTFTASDLAAVSAAVKEPEHRPRSSHDQATWRDALKMVGHAQREWTDTRQKLSQAAAAAGDIRFVVDIETTRRSGQLTLQLYRLTHTTTGSDAADVGKATDGRATEAKANDSKSTDPKAGEPKTSDSIGVLMPAVIDPRTLEHLENPTDREVLPWFFGVASAALVRSGAWDESAGVAPLRGRGHSFVISDSLRAVLLERIAKSGRLGWFSADDVKQDASVTIDAKHLRPLAWDGAAPWSFRLAVAVRKPESHWQVRGEFRRGGATVPLTNILVAFADGLVILKDRLVRMNLPEPRAYAWISALHLAGPFKVEKAAQATFLKGLVDMTDAPPIDLPSDAGFSMSQGQVRPRLVFLPMPIAERAMVLMANYEFDYEAPAAPAAPGGRRRRGRPAPAPTASAPGEANQTVEGEVPPKAAEPRQEVPTSRLILSRDPRRETELVQTLCSHPGVHPSAGRLTSGADVFVDAAGLPELVNHLTSQGWSVESEGRKLRAGRSFNVDVRSGVDWLNLRASFDFGGGAEVALPEILAAMRRGDDRVQLGDGTVGLLPEAWLKNLEPILRMGDDANGDGSLRYQQSHGAFLDVLVAEAAHAHLDESFAAYRAKLATFAGIKASAPDGAFHGELRPYQCQGLGWLEFLDEFAFGGCLADDMGLGKTVQVLAHLQKRRRGPEGKKLGPSLIVAPTSLIHNWVDEAKRFVPDLTVLAHQGQGRSREAKPLLKVDLVITSYGTLRSDVEMLSGITFDYVALDEAQAIKNETTQAAKAVRALKANRRLAMSGTPVENRLAELGSIFRFLNPGMLDNAAGFAELFSGSGKLAPGKIQTLARALRPFILRRTKEQVLPDLPGKTETTIYCVLDDEQRREYDALAAHYRGVLTKKVQASGLGKSRMAVLEALLRLRQLACHPGLIDGKRASEPSAKLDLLEEQLEEVMDTGRKALVFSQFTSMLSLVRTRLEEKGIVYEYLDGSTMDRKERVEHFQNDPNVKVFLISLKAGGVGLNLTAADYCFILDPWWNPASEAQAIDRAHRIGQKNHVFAYRLIARGTVEEKILELQAAKRKLVEGIIADDGGVISDLSIEDLDFLLA